MSSVFVKGQKIHRTNKEENQDPDYNESRRANLIDNRTEKDSYQTHATATRLVTKNKSHCQSIDMRIAVEISI